MASPSSHEITILHQISHHYLAGKTPWASRVISFFFQPIARQLAHQRSADPEQGATGSDGTILRKSIGHAMERVGRI